MTLSLLGIIIGVILICMSETVMGIISARRRRRFQEKLEKMMKESREQK